MDLDVSGTSLQVGVPKTLISTRILNLIAGRTHYDVTRDGRRFLLSQPAGAQRPAITVLVNSTEKLKKYGRLLDLRLANQSLVGPSRVLVIRFRLLQLIALDESFLL